MSMYLKDGKPRPKRSLKVRVRSSALWKIRGVREFRTQDRVIKERHRGVRSTDRVIGPPPPGWGKK